MINIKKKLSFIYKYLVKQLFKIIYGEITFHKDTFQSTDIEIEKVKDTSLRDSDNLEYSIFKIKNGRVFTDYVENVAIINKQKIVNEAFGVYEAPSESHAATCGRYGLDTAQHW